MHSQAYTYTGQWSPDATSIASGDGAGAIKIWNPANSALISSIQATAGMSDTNCQVTSLRWTPDGSQIVAAIGDSYLDGSSESNTCQGRLVLLDASTGAVVATSQVSAFSKSANAVRVHPDGDRFVWVTDRGPILWCPSCDAPNYSEKYMFDYDKTRLMLDLSPDGTRVAMVDTHKDSSFKPKILYLKSTPTSFEFGSDDYASEDYAGAGFTSSGVAFSNDGTRVAVLDNGANFGTRYLRLFSGHIGLKVPFSTDMATCTIFSSTLSSNGNIHAHLKI